MSNLFPLYSQVPFGSSSCRGMCIQDNAAEFAGTMDSTAAAEEQQSHQLLPETGLPKITNTTTKSFVLTIINKHLIGTEVKVNYKML